MSDDRAAWTRQLRLILDITADAMRTLRIANNAVGVSGDIHGAAADSTENRFGRIVKLVREANEIAVRIGEPTLIVPGEKPEIDLRPWWSRVLENVSSTARRNTAGEQL